LKFQIIIWALLATLFLPIISSAQLPIVPYNVSKQDRLFAENFHKLIRLNRKRSNDIIPKDIITHLLHSLKDKQSPFIELKPLIKQLAYIRSSKLTYPSFNRSCLSTSITPEKSSALYLMLKESIQVYCTKYFERVLSKRKNTPLPKRSLEYLSDNLPTLLKSKHRSSRNIIFKIIKNKPTLLSALKRNLENNRIRLSRYELRKVNLSNIARTKVFPKKVNQPIRKLIKDLTRSIKEDDQSLVAKNSSILKEQLKLLSSEKDKNKLYNMVGKRLLYGKHFETSKKFFHHAYNTSNKSTEHESLFNLLWSSIYAQNYRNAYLTILDHSILKNFDEMSNQIKFWTSYTLLKINKKREALFRLRQLTTQSPMSYYSILALQIINGKDEKNYIENSRFRLYANVRHPSSKMPISLNKYANTYLKRIYVWMNVGYSNYLQKDLTQLLSVVPEEKHEVFLQRLAEIFNNNRHYLQSFKLLNKSLSDNVLSLNPQIVKSLFPTPYMKSIEKYSAEIEPLVILSLIRQESAFDPKAQSLVGARGLMQLMPATARYMKKEVRTPHLVNPITNIRIGIKYYKYLLKKFDHNVIHTLAAYNAGEHRVRRWKKDLFHVDNPLFTIESIPFKETRLYVKLIYRNLFFYNVLRNDKDGPTTFKGDFLTFNSIH